MPTLVIKSFPEALYSRLKQAAAAHRRSLTQETIQLLDEALNAPKPRSGTGTSYWANRPLLHDYEMAMKAGAFSGGKDSTTTISEERDTR